MNHPDARTADLASVLNWMMDHIEALENARGEKRISATAACKALGFGAAYCYEKKPIRYPNFRAGIYPLATWRAWLERPEGERQAEWDKLSVVERRKILEGGA